MSKSGARMLHVQFVNKGFIYDLCVYIIMVQQITDWEVYETKKTVRVTHPRTYKSFHAVVDGVFSKPKKNTHRSIRKIDKVHSVEPCYHKHGYCKFKVSAWEFVEGYDLVKF